MSKGKNNSFNRTYNSHVDLDVGAGCDGTWKNAGKIVIRYFVQKSPPVCVCVSKMKSYTHVHAILQHLNK